MMRRSPALSAVLAAVLVLAGRTAPVSAGNIVYSLVNNTGSPLTQADIEVSPAGAVQAPPSTLTIVNPIPAGFNFSPASQGGEPLQVALGTSTGANFDGLVFTFVSTTPGDNTQPLPSGDSLNFTLNTVAGYTGTPSLTLFDPPSGLSLKVIKPTATSTPTPNVQTSTPGPTNTPEPLSVVLWSTLAGAGLVRARKLKLRRATAQG